MHSVDSQLKTLLICNINANAAPVNDLCKVEPIMLCHDQHDIVSACSACGYSEESCIRKMLSFS